MKKIINLITVIFCIWFSSTAIAQSVFWSDSFEQSYVRTTSSDFLCGGTSATSYFTKTNSGAEISVAFGSYSAYHLANFWAGENVDFGSSCTNNSQSANQTITWSNINIAGQSSISFKGLFAANNAGLPTNWEGSAFGTLPQDYVIVEYRIDAGAWTQALAFYASSSTQSSSLSQDTNGDLIGDGLALTGAFSEFTANITGTGTNLSLRLSAHSDQLNEEFAVDNFRLLSPLTATQSQVNTFCNGACNGSAKVVASGGVAPYTYSWSPSGGSAATASGLCAGTYTCTITDNALSTITKSFTITQPSAIVVSASSQTNVSCNGGSNGAASINMPTGGEPGYTYDWTPGTPAGDGTRSVTGLSAGTWTCTVTDANSCTKTQTFTITQPSAIVVSADPQSSVYCYTNNNGAASINIPTGGTGPYTYNWTSNIDPTTFNVTRSVTGLRAGPVYTCTVMDSNGCTKSLDFIINTELSVSADTQTNVSCNGGNNGAAKVSGFGGARTAPEYGYYFNWTPGNPTGDGTRSVTGLSAGTWTCTVTDGNGCTKTQTFTITQPSAIAVSAASQTNVSCNGGSNGAASVNTSGGTPGYTYNWTPGNPTGDGTPSVTGLSAGTWTCTVTDINGCTKTQTFTITQPSAILLSAVSQTNVSCNGGSNGSASVTLSGGAGGYTYYWSPSGGTAATATGLSAGTWTCYVTDSEGCTKTVNFTVTQPSAIVVSAASQTNVSCNGGSNGAASINTPTGGTPGYTYNWSPGTPTGDGTPSVTGLSAGTWTCTVTDANSCTATKTFTITEPSPLEVSAASQTNEVCYRGYFGSASINIPTGGTAPYTYDWTPGNPTGDGTRSVNFLSAGTWTCTVTDNNGCTATLNFTITEPSPLQVSAASQTNVSCNGQNNGAASVNTTGGEPEYTYEWTPGTPAGDGTPSVSGLSAGRWTCYVTDSNGCYKTQEFYITVNDTQAPVISCQANITGVVATSAAGAIVNYTTPVGTDNCTGATTSRIAGLASGDTFPIGVTTVTHRVTDAAGLTADCSFTVTVVGVAPAITCPANISVNNTTGQCGAAVTFAATETVGIPASVITYSIASGSNFSVGTTQVTATATNAVGSSSCTFDVIVNDNQAPSITCAPSVTINNTEGLCTGTTTLTEPSVSDNCSTVDSLGSSNTVTYEAWIYPNGTQPSAAGIIFRRDGGSATGIDFGFSDPSKIGYHWNDNPATYFWTGGPTYIANQWNHVALVIEPTKATIYLNGVPYVNNVANPVINLGGTTRLGVDDCCGNRYFNGSMDEVRIWNYALSQAEINASMNAELAGTEQGLVSYYKFNQGTAGGANAGLTSLTASKGNNGTLNNFALSGSSSNWATGEIANGLVFDGNNDNVAIGTLNLNSNLLTLSSNHPSTTYPIGNTTVTWTATDASGNTATCNQTVTVNDTQAPVISCQADITNVVASSAAGAVVNYTIPVGTDNCTGANTTRIAGLASGATFPIGTTTVTHLVTDAANLTAQCSFTVTVVGVAPSIACPANISVNNTTGQCGAVVTFAATETVGIPASVITYSIASGSNFSVGTTQVTATATNAAGSSSCTFDVTVNDAEAPSITCPIAVTVNANEGQCYATNVLLGLSLPIAIINPDFEILYKAGSTSVTSPLLGIGKFAYGITNSNMAGPTVTFSDGSTGNRFDLPGWTFNAPNSLAMGITNENSNFGIGRNMITFINGETFGGGSAEKTMSQTLAENLQQNTSYTLTADFGWRNDNSFASPPVLKLYAGATLLTPIASNSPALVKGSFVSYTRTYLINNNAISGPLRIEFGIDANTNSEQLNTDHITLSKTLAIDTIDNCAIATVIPTLNGNPVTAATQFPVGNNTVIWTATDTASNTVTCNQTITVNDTQAPAISCQANITNVVATSAAGAVVNYTTPVGTDNCTGAITTRTAGLASGATFPIGVTTVTHRVTDAAGLTADCSFTVTVLVTNTTTITACNSYTWPVNGETYTASGTHTLNAGATAFFNSLSGLTSAVSAAGYTLPTTQTFNSIAQGYATSLTGDFGAGSPTWTASAYNGLYSGYDGGSYIISTNGGGQPLTISFSPGVTSVGANFFVTNFDFATVSGTITLTLSDGSTQSFYTNTANSFGGFVSHGAYITSIIIATSNDFVTVDNLVVSTGTTTPYVIEVLDLTIESPTNITCPANITASSEAGLCGATVTYPVATATGTPAPTITYSIPSGSFFPVGTTEVTATAASNSCGAPMCTFTVTVNDTQVPVITCQADITNVIATSAAGAVVNYTTPVGTDNCTGAITTRTAGLASGDTFPIGTTTVTHKVIDAAGLTADCSFTVTVVGVAPELQCNLDTFVSNDAGQCGAIVTFDTFGTLGIPAALVTYSTSSGATTSGSVFPVGTTYVTATATNDFGSSSCSFGISVYDEESPVITCQANITNVVATSAAGAVVNYTTPVGTDNCTGAITTRIAGLASGATFPIGVTTVTHRVIDAAGLTADCSFTVTVVGVAPAITCPANISVNNTTGQCGAAVTFAATETVGIPASVITYSIASGSNFSVGTTQVTATATNAVGSSSCTFDVIVNDTEKPVITCPANISATSNIGCATAVEVGTATATDNCGVDHVSGVRSDALALNALYPEGVTTITWTATDIHGIDSTICEQTVTVTGQQAVASISSQTICSGLPMSNIAVSGGVLGTTYSWTRDNGANVTGIATSGSGDISGGVLTNTTNDPVTVTFTITPNYDGCAGKSVTAIVIVNPKAETPVISGNAPFCQGSSVTLDAGSGYASYSWSNGATTQTTAVSNATPVSVSVTNSFGCSATSLSVTPVVNSLSVAPTSITPSVAIATPGSNFTLSVNGGSLGTAANWKWYTTSCGGTLVGTGASISVSQMVNTTYYVRAEGTCNTTACASVTVNIQCGASVIISSVGTTTVCPGTVVTLTPVGALSTGAQWRWDDDCDAVPSTSDSSATYTTASSFTVTPTCTTTYYLQSVGGACGVTGCLSVTVNVIAKPATPGTIGGLAIVCPSTSGTYSIAAVANATSYTWTAPTNATMIVAANGLSAVLTYSSTFVSGTLSVKANNCAGSSTSKTLAITKTATPATPGTITGLASVCPSTSGAYSIATVANATSYTWTAPANASITAGQGTASVTVSYASGFTTGTLSVKATGCGGTSVAKTLTVTKTTAPATPVTISGLATVCASTSGTYSIAAVANATSYTWTAPVNASITAGQGTTSVTVTYASGFTTGTLSVIATGCGGTSAAKTLAISKTAIPATPGAITGASPACAASTQTYSITAVPNATSYTWTLPTGMSYVANSSTTGTVIQVVLASTFSGGTLSVKATNCSGSSATVSKVLTASALPTSAGTITGPTTVCKRAKLLTYSVAAATGFTFNWSVPSGAVITAGAGTNSIKVTWGTVSGNVSVTKVNACGSSAASTLAVSSATCRDTQDVVVTLFKAVAYPNPFAENFMINVTSSSQEMVGLKVYDMIGRLIEQREVKVSDLENSTIGDRYPSGVYNILVTQGEEVKTVRVVKR